MIRFLKRLWCRLWHPRSEWLAGGCAIYHTTHTVQHRSMVCRRCLCEHERRSWIEELPPVRMSRVDNPNDWNYTPFTKPE